MWLYTWTTQALNWFMWWIPRLVHISPFLFWCYLAIHAVYKLCNSRFPARSRTKSLSVLVMFALALPSAYLLLHNPSDVTDKGSNCEEFVTAQCGIAFVEELKVIVDVKNKLNEEMLNASEDISKLTKELDNLTDSKTKATKDLKELTDSLTIVTEILKNLTESKSMATEELKELTRLKLKASEELKYEMELKENVSAEINWLFEKRKNIRTESEGSEKTSLPLELSTQLLTLTAFLPIVFSMAVVKIVEMAVLKYWNRSVDVQPVAAPNNSTLTGRLKEQSLRQPTLPSRTVTWISPARVSTHDSTDCLREGADWTEGAAAEPSDKRSRNVGSHERPTYVIVDKKWSEDESLGDSMVEVSEENLTPRVSEIIFQSLRQNEEHQKLLASCRDSKMSRRFEESVEDTGDQLSSRMTSSRPTQSRRMRQPAQGTVLPLRRQDSTEVHTAPARQQETAARTRAFRKRLQESR